MSRGLVVRWSFVKILLVVLNVVTTILTVITGLWYTPVLTTITGRYDYIRQRLRSGSINWGIVEPLHFRLQDFASPVELAEYSVSELPRRDHVSFGEYRSVCTTINTMAAPVLVSYFDDFWGKGARRVQTNMYSISAPTCDVVTVTHAWRDQCVASYDGNTTRCHAFVLEQFDTLLEDLTARALAVDDFGVSGVPFLRCRARPLESFPFQADLLSYESIWAGSDNHVTIQTSDCRAEPLVQSQDKRITLFEAVNVDDGADMVVLLPPDGWIGFLILWVHSIATVVVVSHGMVLALLHSKTARYLPEGLRFGHDSRWLQFAVPFMPLVTHFAENERAVITFKGALFIASDVWKTHWMYMWVSVLDGLAHLRKMYVTFQLASMLMFTPETFLYLCGAITKITWVMCFVQTMLRIIVKLFARCLRSLRIITTTTRAHIEWDVDGLSMFLSWRIYNLILSVIVFLMFLFHSKPSFMKPASPAIVGAYGGPIKIAGFAGSELACDLVTLLALTTLTSEIIGLLLIKCTKYKYVADNSIMRLLGDRYWLSGWDGLMTADMLGLDPTEKDFMVDGYGYTKMTLGTLLTLMYQSGPSGLVRLAGDYVFHDNGFSKEPKRFTYAVQKAMSMGLFVMGATTVSAKTTNATHTTPASAKYQVQPTDVSDISEPIVKTSIYDRSLRVVSEGYFGKLLLVDLEQPGQLKVNRETGQREYEVIDALTTMGILDIKWLLGSKKKIRVR